MNIHRHILVTLVCTLLLTTSAAAAYKGSKLARGPVEDFTLTTQDNATYNFDADSEGVTVIAFIFTRCPDVCPAITQLLKGVEGELSERESEDVTFISITVDPEYDTPERLAEFTALHGVEWPHLTGTVEEMEPIWENFGLVVQQNVIEAHVMDYQPAETSVTIVNTSGNASNHMVEFSGWTLTELLAEQANISVNASLSTYGHMIHGFDGVDSPSDWSWYWELNTWNQSALTWEMANVGVDSIDGFENSSLAWMPSTSNRSELPAPNATAEASMSVMWPNGTTVQSNLSSVNAYHATKGGLYAADVNVSIEMSTYGHYLTSLNNETAPSTYEWWWNLYLWNGAAETWETSDYGMDEVVEPSHIAWAPSNVNISEIPAPVQNQSDTSVCNGHGWLMGSGDSMHCMCDAGYGWDEDDRLSCISETTEEYTVGHSTITYILNPDREPTVAWTGDRWLVEDFTADLREILDRENLGGFSDENTPSLSLLLTTLSVASAVIVLPRREVKGDEKEGKGGKMEAPPLN